jgi:hypothetical protein
MDNRFKITLTAVSEGGGSEVTGVQMLVERHHERWESGLLSPAEFAELMLSSHIFPPEKAGRLFLRLRNQGQITEENVALTEEWIQFLRLRRAA